ncbi:mycothione reductase [Actinomycetospora sp. NBRC 106375]|uniref:mycothione reductase n=1 Tax=Actinomycetospora sp. NBRC 106375 TaxID=3032207 RepID=UPI0024A54129|nr:mycothione reductase [Actinomycetospora sp. NBRC 106375]GLZ45065.1 mycothione reductase [Actinomycetospora sp. NBRC 106375]
MPHHDLVIIGTGSGNSIPDERFAGLDVAIVEHGIYGGTCLNVGCIPTKMFVYAADVAEIIRRSGTYGIDASIDKIRWTDIRDRVFSRIDPISAGGRRYRQEQSDTTVYLGHARFTGERALEVTPTDGGAPVAVTGDRFVVAAGARPAIPEKIVESGVPYYTSDDVMRIDEVPRRLTIIGGGYIAAEFAHVFSALGSEVTIATRGPALLREQDEEISARFTELAATRWNVLVDAAPTAPPEQRADGTIVVHCQHGQIEADALLVATGRLPNGDRLDAAAGGLDLHPDGRIVVDEQQRTSVPGVWALGDVSSPFQLKHVANHEAAVVRHNLLHPDDPRATNNAHVPSAVFTDPQIATIGLREQDCRERGIRYVTKVQRYGDVAFGWAMEDTTGVVKLIADPTDGTLLGAHLMGPEASSLIQPLIQAITFGLDARTMAEHQYWIHPALPEVIENALLGLALDPEA